MNTTHYRVALIEDNADDEALSLRAIRRALGECEVRVSRDGEEAMRHLGIWSNDPFGGFIPDLIVCDDKMPKLNGAELLRSVRQDPRFDEVPVVMFSSSNESEDIDRCLSAGATTYVVKPVAYTEYLATLGAIVEQTLGREGSGNA